MLNIKEFFEKFSKIQKDVILSKQKVADVIKKISGVDIDQTKIRFENGILRLDINPVLKNEIFMHKNKILNEFKLNTLSIKDIR